MKILYQFPSTNTIYAGRTIFNGYKNAFLDLGHEFRALTSLDNSRDIFEEFCPDIFITSLTAYYIKFLDLGALFRQKKAGMKVFINTPLWNSPFSPRRLNENTSLSSNKDMLKLIQGGVGDAYFNVCEKDTQPMDGFAKETGQIHRTLPLAADVVSLVPKFNEAFRADISFIGTYLPNKRPFFDKQVFPLREKYSVRLYGQDWTLSDRALGWIQRGGQYLNIPFLGAIRKPKLNLSDEGDIYNSSIISLNIHEDFQKIHGSDCNERTFKIPLSGGFEITDNVKCIHKYFVDNKEIIIAKTRSDWFEKIDYFMRNPDKRLSIIEAGRNRVLTSHTYHHRVNEMLGWYIPSKNGGENEY